MKKIYFVIALFLSMGMVGCDDKEDNKQMYPDAKIIKELPVMNGSCCEDGKTLIVNSQKELEDLFRGTKLPNPLANINFNTYTIIFSSLAGTPGVVGFRQEFIKIENNKYQYTLFVNFSIDNSAMPKTFGVVVTKIPSDSEIIFNVNKL